MKIGEKIIIERTPSGLYKVTAPNGDALVGAAAITALHINSLVFLSEAVEFPPEKA